MAIAAPTIDRDGYLERILKLIPQEAMDAPLNALQSDIAIRAQQAMEAGDSSKVEALRQQCSTMIGFTEYRFPRYQPARHHRLIAAQLERVERREIDRLMLLVPPRHGKTELASKSYPAWSLGRNPWKQFLSASATYDLANDWGQAVRNIIASEEYTTVFPTRLSEDSRAAGKWNTSQGGSYYALGVGGSVMGRGADDWLIDDPYGSIEDAKSEVIRNKVWEWFNGTVYNRLQPGGSIVLINHRMHEDDQWTIVQLPAIAVGLNDALGREPGEALWPEWFPIHPELERRQANTLARYWSALYQQNPVPEEGELFSPDLIGLRDRTDDVIQWVRGWDLAGSVDGDYTVGALVGRTRDARFVVGNIVRFRGRPDEVEDKILETARLDTRRTKISLPREPAQAGLAQEMHLTQKLAGFAPTFSPESGDKATRAEPFAAQVNHGLVTMITAQWNAAYREELRSFPYGKYDDQVDASSRAFMTLLETKPPMRISQAAVDRA